jgi:hypothetical protein
MPKPSREDTVRDYIHVDKIFVTKDEFHATIDSLKDNIRDRQDDQTQILVDKITRSEEILEQQREMIKTWRDECNDDIDKVEDRVSDLERSARNQTVVGSLIAGAVGVVAAIWGRG